jgi:hypothetical protein
LLGTMPSSPKRRASGLRFLTSLPSVTVGPVLDLFTYEILGLIPKYQLRAP